MSLIFQTRKDKSFHSRFGKIYDKFTRFILPFFASKTNGKKRNEFSKYNREQVEERVDADDVFYIIFLWLEILWPVKIILCWILRILFFSNCGFIFLEFINFKFIYYFSESFSAEGGPMLSTENLLSKFLDRKVVSFSSCCLDF